MAREAYRSFQEVIRLRKMVDHGVCGSRAVGLVFERGHALVNRGGFVEVRLDGVERSAQGGVALAGDLDVTVG